MKYSIDFNSDIELALDITINVVNSSTLNKALFDLADIGTLSEKIYNLREFNALEDIVKPRIS
jgi:hypothetical protein